MPGRLRGYDMTEESSESLVKVYLENRGYLVTTNKHIRLEKVVNVKHGKKQIHNPAYEIDIIAINPKTKDKIIGEVKGTQHGLHSSYFRKLKKPMNQGEARAQRGLKIVNDTIFRNKLKKEIEKEYGIRGFRIFLFVDHIAKNDKNAIESLAKQQRFNICTFEEILEYLDKHVLDFAYSNDPIMQLLRIQDRIAKE